MQQQARPGGASDSSALRLWVILARAHRAIELHATADAARHGLTLAEFGALEALFHKGPMLLNELRQKILVSSGGVTYIADRLVRIGLAVRRPDPNDRRAVYVALTAKGRRLVRRVFPAHEACLSRALSGLDPQEVGQARTLLRTLGRYAADA